MSVSGLCQICEAARATGSCDRCGALVCRDHYDPDRGLCTECLAEVGGGNERGTGGSEDGNDGSRGAGEPDDVDDEGDVHYT